MHIDLDARGGNRPKPVAQALNVRRLLGRVDKALIPNAHLPMRSTTDGVFARRCPAWSAPAAR